MEKLRLKTTLSVLWIALVVNHIAFIFLTIIKSGDLSTLPERATYTLTIWFFIPCIMAWLSLILKDSVNRWTNLTLGTIFAIVKVLVLSVHLIEEGLSGIAINALWGLLAAALVVWYAWKWPKQEA